MKHLKKFLVLGLAVSMTAMLAACGSSGGGSDAAGSAGTEAAAPTVDENGIPYGTYVAVSAEMMGVQMSMDEISENGEPFTIELKEKGKVSMNVEGESGNGKYTVEGDQITISVQGQDMVGTYSENSIVFDDMLGMGITMYFGLEGTDAADPSNYISDEAKEYVGTWVSTSVTDALGDEADIPADALQLDFAQDGTVTGTFNGEAIGPFEWDTILGLNIVSEDPSFLISDGDEEGTIKIEYISDADGYYCFVMSKQ